MDKFSTDANGDAIFDGDYIARADKPTVVVGRVQHATGSDGMCYRHIDGQLVRGLSEDYVYVNAESIKRSVLTPEGSIMD
jgi:hypothetical protein